MNEKIMFSGGTLVKGSFHTISRDELIALTSSIKSLFQLTNNLNLNYEDANQMFDSIQYQDDYCTLPNFDIHFIQSEILNAFDSNSSFYFALDTEGFCTLISFAETVSPLHSL